MLSKGRCDLRRVDFNTQTKTVAMTTRDGPFGLNRGSEHTHTHGNVRSAAGRNRERENCTVKLFSMGLRNLTEHLFRFWV